jgi:hypothetical protein
MALNHTTLVRLWMNTVVGVFTPGMTITGGTSGNKAVVAKVAATYLDIRARSANGDFTMGETITGTVGITAVVEGYMKIEWGGETGPQFEARRTCSGAADVFIHESIGEFGKGCDIFLKENNVGAGSINAYSGSTVRGWVNESGAVAILQNGSAGPIRFNDLGKGLEVTAAKSGATNADVSLEGRVIKEA